MSPVSLRGRLQDFLRRYRRILNDSFWVMFSQVINGLAVFGGVRLVTQYASPDIYGWANLVLGTVILGRGLLTHPITQAQMRIYSDVSRDGRISLLTEVVNRLLGRSLIILVLLLWTGGAVYCWIYGDTYWMFLFAGIYAVLDVIKTVDWNLLQMARHQKQMALLTILENTLRPLCTLGFLFLIGTTHPEPLILGYIPVTLLGWLLGKHLWRRQAPAESLITREERSSHLVHLRREVITYALPLVPLSVFGWISAQGDRYVVGGFLGKESVGIYAAAYGLMSQPFSMVFGLLYRLLTPPHYQSVADRDHAKERRILQVFMGVTLVVSLVALAVVYYFSPLLARIGLGPQYREGAIPLMPWIALGYLLSNVSNVLQARLYAFKKTMPILWINGIGAVGSIIVPLLFVRWWGLKGVAMACPVYFLLQATLSLVMAMRVYKPPGRTQNPQE